MNQNDFLLEISEIQSDNVNIDQMEQTFIETVFQATNIPVFKLINEDLSRKTTKLVPMMKQIFNNYLEAIEKAKNIKQRIKEESFTLQNAFEGCEISFNGVRKYRDSKYECIYKFTEFLKDKFINERNNILSISIHKGNENTSANYANENNIIQKLSELYSNNVSLKNENEKLTNKYYELLEIIKESYDLELLKDNIRRIERG